MKNKIVVETVDDRYKYIGEDYRAGAAPEDVRMMVISDNNGVLAYHYGWKTVTIERDV